MTHIQHTRASIRTPYTHRHTVIARGYFLQPLYGVSAVLTFSAFRLELRQWLPGTAITLHEE